MRTWLNYFQLLDHGALLRAVGVTPHEFWRECGLIFDEMAAGIFSPPHVLAPVRFVIGPNQTL